MDQEIISTFKQLGLTEKEIKIYLALLPLGSAPASTLGKRTGLPRTTAGFTCNQLVKKDLLASCQKGKSFIYSIDSPDKLLYLIEEEKENLKNKESRVNRVLGELKMIFNPSANLPKVKFFEGVDGIIKLLNDSLKHKGPLYGATQYYEDIPGELKKHHKEVYIPKRIAAANPSWFIFNDNKATREYQKKDKKMNRTSLLVSEKDFPFNASIQIYDNKVAFYSIDKKDMTGVLIENEIIKEAQLSLFKLAWDKAKTLKLNEKYRNIDI